jgi:hypothetical protein
MSGLAEDLAQDRALRDAALGVFRTDLAFIRDDLKSRGVGGRIADRIGDSAKDMLDDAVDYAEDNRGQVAAAVAAIVLWLARAPLLNGLARVFDFDDGDAEQQDAESRSQDD